MATVTESQLVGIRENQYRRISSYGENEQNDKNFEEEHNQYPEAESKDRGFFPIVANQNPEVFKPFTRESMPLILTSRLSKLRYAINEPTNHNSHLKIAPGII
jgi:hypothetical protein